MDRHKSERGSYTIEASMIFSMIVLTIVLLIFTFSYMQQKVHLQSIASFAAQQGAELWLDSRRNMENGALNPVRDADSLGYRVFDNLLLSQKTFEGYIEKVENSQGRGGYVLKLDTGSSLPGRKVLLIGEAICRKMGGTVIRPDITRVRITYSNNIISGKLSVEITQEIKVPLGGIKQFLDGKDTLTLSARSEAAVSEPDETIRNVDLAVELFKRFEGGIDFEGMMDKIKAKGQK